MGLNISLLPSSDALAGQLLIWLGVPILLVTILVTALNVLDYVYKIVRLVALGKRAAGTITTLIGSSNSTKFAIAMVGLVTSQGALLALTYSLSQLAQVTLEENLGGGRLYDTPEIISRVVDYERWTPITSNVVITVVVLILMSNVGVWTRTSSLAHAPLKLLYPVAIACLGLALIAVIPGICVFLLGLANNGGYTVGMSSLYALWIGLLVLWAAALVGAEDCAERACTALEL